MKYEKFAFYPNFNPLKFYLVILTFEWIDKFHFNVIS